ncbi:MAG TPA: stage II sporulation protein M [Anaerolineaceae bacterium]|nr:stage II sporulation protein M [Anaerolineaceae bacterium]
MFSQLRPAFIITEREVRDQLRDWRIIFPVIGLTIFFPFLMNFTAQQMLGFVRQYGATIIGERMVPFLLMIVGFFPISVSLVIALETFVGEKERSSIEPLLNSPLKDWQLYLGKLLSAVVPPLFSSYLGMTVYIIGLAFSRIKLPSADLMVLIFLLTTVQAVMMVSGAVVVSCQATSVRAANLLASFIIIPVALLIQGESVVMFWGNYRTLWWAVIGLIVLAGLLMRVGLAHFRREELLGREIDVLNLHWGWGIFSKAFTGGAHTPKDWYLKTIPQTLRRIRYPILIMTILAAVGFVLGAAQVHNFDIPLKDTNVQNLNQSFQRVLNMWPLFSYQPVLAIWWQNMRVMLLAMLLGVFSMGILGVIPLMASMGVTGYLIGLLSLHGMSLNQSLGLILPHGFIEIPAVIIASAAVLQAGAILATPTPDKTVGEVWLAALADWVKLMVGLVIPLLLIAAGIEAWVTPRVAMLFFH